MGWKRVVVGQGMEGMAWRLVSCGLAVGLCGLKEGSHGVQGWKVWAIAWAVVDWRLGPCGLKENSRGLKEDSRGLEVGKLLARGRAVVG